MSTFILNEDQLAMKKVAQDFVERYVRPVIAEWDEKGGTPPEVYKQAVKHGFTSLAWPEEFGGLQQSYLTQVVVNEELSKGDIGIANALGASSFAARPVLNAGTPEQKQYVADVVIKQGGMASFALTEPNAGSDASQLRTTAVKDGDEYVLNGRKCFITNAPNAQFFVVFAKTDPSRGHRGISAFLVERNRPGVSTSKHEEKMGFRLSTAGDLVLEDVRVPADHLIGVENKGYGLAMKILDYSRIGVAAEAVGLAQRALDLAVEYSKSRVTFGKPISQHQMIMYKLAEMEMRIQAARSLTYQAAELADNGVAGFGKISSCAKAYASETAVFVVNEALQIFGGYGYMKDYEIEKLYRDAKLLPIFEGTNEIQHLIVSGYLLK